jgi:hypothetical protein
MQVAVEDIFVVKTAVQHRLVKAAFAGNKKARALSAGLKVLIFSNLPESFLDDLLEIILTGLDDAEFALGVFG